MFDEMINQKEDHIATLLNVMLAIKIWAVVSEFQLLILDILI